MGTPMTWTRRQFLKALAGAAAALGVPWYFHRIREPYVAKGEVVDYIGRTPGGFIGGVLVAAVGEWDGVGYPIIVRAGQWPARTERYYDHDLAAFRREVPERFWHLPGHREVYPNVHTYVRVQRFGETREEAIRHLNFAGIRWCGSPESAG